MPGGRVRGSSLGEETELTWSRSAPAGRPLVILAESLAAPIPAGLLNGRRPAFPEGRRPPAIRELGPDADHFAATAIVPGREDGVS